MEKKFRVQLRCFSIMLIAMVILTSIMTPAKAACVHDSIEIPYRNWLTYYPWDANRHSKKTYSAIICNFCGEFISCPYPEVSLFEAHTMNSKGRCIYCGYTSTSSSTCKHTKKESEKINSVSERYDDTNHRTIVTYRDVCADCGAVLTAERKDTNLFPHQFGNGNTCFCGYTKKNNGSGSPSHSPAICLHTNKKTEKINSSTHRYNNDQHKIIITYKDTCKDCGYVINASRKTETFSNHYFGEDGRCACGYTKDTSNTCKHPDFKKVISTTFEDDPNSDDTHIIVTTYAATCFCGERNPNPVKRSTAACRFTVHAGVNDLHEEQGHQYVVKCECGNEKANGKYKAYVSGCVVCGQLYDSCVLSRGNASNIPEKVKELQELLMRSGYDLPYYGADGDFSRETENAVKKFQKDHGLPVTGIVDEATWNALKNTLNYTDTLSKGNTSNKSHVVKALQELLIKNGYDLPYYGADGDFSRETEKAVKQFQKDHGLPETGVVDEATWAKLRNPDGTFETGAPSHGPMEGLTDDKPSHSPEETLPPRIDDDSEVSIDGLFDEEGSNVDVPVTACDHTVGEPVLISEEKAKYANNDEHLIVCIYEKACACREIVESYQQDTLRVHVLSKSYSYELEHKEGLGHRKFYVCSVCNGHSLSGGDNPGKNDYLDYVKELGGSEKCLICYDEYILRQKVAEAQTLLQGLGYDIGAAGVDGILGKDTIAALNAFRTDVMGLDAIGYVDSATLEALRKGIDKNNEQEIPLEQESSTLQDLLKDEKQAIMNDSVDLLEDMANGKNSIYDQFFTYELKKEIELLSEGTAAKIYDFIDGDADALIFTAQADYYVETLMKQCADINSDSKTISIAPADFEMFCDFLGFADSEKELINDMVEKWSYDRWTDKYGEMILNEKEWQAEMDKYQITELEWLSSLGTGVDIASFLWNCLYDYHVYSTAYEGTSAIMIESAYDRMHDSNVYAAERASHYLKSCETVEGRIAYIILKNADIADYARDEAFDLMLYNPSFEFAYDGATLFNDVMFGTTDMLEANHGTYWSMQIVEELHDELNNCIDRYKYEPSEDNYNDCLGTYSLYMTYLISTYNGVLDSIEIYSSSLAANIIGDGLTDKEKALVDQMRMFMEWYADDIEYALENHTVEAIMDRLRLEAMSE